MPVSENQRLIYTMVSSLQVGFLMASYIQANFSGLHESAGSKGNDNYSTSQQNYLYLKKIPHVHNSLQCPR